MFLCTDPVYEPSFLPFDMIYFKNASKIMTKFKQKCFDAYPESNTQDKNKVHNNNCDICPVIQTLLHFFCGFFSPGLQKSKHFKR